MNFKEISCAFLFLKAHSLRTNDVLENYIVTEIMFITNNESEYLEYSLHHNHGGRGAG